MDSRGHPKLNEWKDRQGNRQRIAHINHGLANCDGVFDIILCRAVDVTASPRKVASANLWGRIRGHIKPMDFSPEDGTFLITFVPA